MMDWQTGKHYMREWKNQDLLGIEPPGAYDKRLTIC